MAKKSWIYIIVDNIHPKRFLEFMKELKDEFSLKFLLMLTSGYLGGRGTVHVYLTLNETIFYKEAGYPVSINQTARSISELPMALKGAGGIHTDLFPILGYSISAWMFIYCILGSTSILLLAIIPFDAEYHPFYLPAILFCIAMVQVFFLDVMLQGKYSEIMNKRAQSRGNVIAYSYLVMTLGGLLPALTVGVIADYWGSPRYTFYVTFPISLQPIFFVLSGCIPNDRVAPERNNKFDREKFMKQLPVNILNILLIVIAIGFLFVTLFLTTFIAFWYSIITSVFIMAAQMICLPMAVALISTYLYLGQALYLQVQPTLEYFLLADEICYENGPHFSYTYLKTVLGVVTQLGKLIGLWIYQAVLTKGRYRQIYWISIALRMFAAMFDFVIVKRWNLLIGIPDQYFYLFGHAIVYEITYMLDYLPYGLIIAKLTPPNVEVTLFGLLGSITNYGRTIAILAGGYVASLMNIETGLNEGTPCNFDNLHWLILFSNFILPAVLIPLAFFLIPNKKVGSNIVDDSWENSRYIIPAFINKPVKNRSTLQATTI